MGIVAKGTKTPEMKIMAMRTTVAGGIACGISLKGEESNSPNVEKVKEQNKMPTKNKGRFGSGEKGSIINA